MHLSDGARQVRAVRKALGADAIVGAFAHASRHDGLTAGEIGADYVSFGPVGATGLGDGSTAPLDLFEWWSEMIEVPVVAEGGLTPDLAGSAGGVGRLPRARRRNLVRTRGRDGGAARGSARSASAERLSGEAVRAGRGWNRGIRLAITL